MTEERKIKALVCEKLGSPTASGLGILHVAQMPAPRLAANSVRIRVAAAALNFADALQIEGSYQEKPKLPFIPGNECSGVVTEVGRDVRSLKVGDRVAAVCQGGAFSEEAVAPAIGVVRLPASCSLEAAAGLPVAFGTAFMALNQRAKVQPGETVLVLGAAGGVGLAAVQLAKLAGARVVAVANGSSKLEALRSAGAEVCINMEGRAPEELSSLVKKETASGAGGGGCDVIFDPVGGPLFNAAFKTLNWGGRVLLVGFASGKMPQIPPNVALVKNATVHGIYWGAHMARQPRAFRESLEAVAKAYAAGDIFVRVSHEYGLEQWREAFSVLANRRIVGKLLIVPLPRSML